MRLCRPYNSPAYLFHFAAGLSTRPRLTAHDSRSPPLHQFFTRQHFLILHRHRLVAFLKLIRTSSCPQLRATPLPPTTRSRLSAFSIVRTHTPSKEANDDNLSCCIITLQPSILKTTPRVPHPHSRIDAAGLSLIQLRHSPCLVGLTLLAATLVACCRHQIRHIQRLRQQPRGLELGHSHIRSSNIQRCF